MLVNDPQHDPGIHRCEQLPESGVTVMYGQAFGDVRQSAWHLHRVRETTEADLDQNSMLEEVSESMWLVCVEIRCCPYRGTALDTGDIGTETVAGGPEEDEPYGAFALFDQERWTGRLR